MLLTSSGLSTSTMKETNVGTGDKYLHSTDLSFANNMWNLARWTKTKWIPSCLTCKCREHFLKHSEYLWTSVEWLVLHIIPLMRKQFGDYVMQIKVSWTHRTHHRLEQRSFGLSCWPSHWSCQISSGFAGTVSGQSPYWNKMIYS